MDSVVVVDTECGNSSTFKEKPLSNQTFEVFWVDISHLGNLTKFIICCTAVFIFFLIYGYFQEYIFAFPGFRPFGWYLTLVQFFCYFSLAWVETLIRRVTRRQITSGVLLTWLHHKTATANLWKDASISIKIYMTLALMTLGCIGFSNSSLTYLNYPTQVIFKCCKLIPVMIGGIFILKKRYKLVDYAATLSMCLGLISFTLANSHMSPDFNILGVIMISCALICDAVMGNYQEKVMREHEAPNCEMVLYAYFFGFLYLLIGLVVTNNFLNAFIFCFEHPLVYVYVLLFAGSGYLGIQAILTLVKNYGALTAVTVTTCRKAVTIVISFIMYEKPFTITYLWSGLLIVLGIYLNVISKTGKHIDFKAIYISIRNFVTRNKRKKLLESV